MQDLEENLTKFNCKKIECFIEHFSQDELNKVEDHYLGNYDSEIDLICELLAEIESLDELLLFIQPYLKHKELLQELIFKNGLIIHEDLDYMVFRS